MSNKPRPLSLYDQRAIAQHPCDGVPRFKTGGAMSKPVPYGQAWREIFLACGCTEERDKETKRLNRTFNPTAIRRLGKLNDAYRSAARDFILNWRPPTPAPVPIVTEPAAQSEPKPLPSSCS